MGDSREKGRSERGAQNRQALEGVLPRGCKAKMDGGAAAGGNEEEEVCFTAYCIKIGTMQKRRKSEERREGGNAAVAERWRRRVSLARSMEVPAKKVQGRGPL